MLELSYHTKYTQEEAIAMDYPNNNTKHEKGKHLKYEDYVVIQVRLRDGRKANRIAKELGCAANTVRNIIRKGMTPLYNGKVLRFKAQTARYGGLENLGDKLMKSENFEMALGLFLDLLECHKQYNGLAKPKRDLTIDDIIPYGI